MKHRRIILVFAIVFLVLGLFWLLLVKRQEATSVSATAPVATPSTAEVQPSPIAEAEQYKEASALVESIFSSPIEFYGRVIDQNGDPVPYASIGYTAADKFNDSGSNYTGEADAEGNFNITGIKGAGLAVTARKEGYHLIHNPGDRSLPTSTATFAFGMGPDSYRRPAPTKDKPAVFVLHKMGKAEPLIRVEQSARIPKDGTPVALDLVTGRMSADGNIRVETWTGAPKNGRKFDWRCRITVPGGGLIERKGQFDFEAPSDGYEESVELGVSSDADQWTSDQQRNYFVKLPDGHFARINFRMIAGGNHYFILESFLNPTPGSRNLEFDPAKVIKPTKQ